ncbi:GGDEF/EAL domain-containing protein [Butyrivibrio proteoclasticus B316]|uniref:GGDEF/EAL domain-containing protein n=1 Tax=Butyrivibrio proteoclasticus (strain ATCC 51982 / DSM 14932 / B316) TaxID=515622 RepID=E0RZQ3_BUTPB|nr:EAL domain-containing protein [Butyrivibrio proteoclasticus]ADL35169.1 GGDEF/EAL domain-containing protein [Butyrivibrio proteoclasticus B316]
MQETFTKVELENTTEAGSLVEEKGASGNRAPKQLANMQSWQDKFCEMSGVYAMCLDENGAPLSEFSGNPHEIEIIKKYVTDVRIHNIYKRVSESELEDQAVEITEVPNLRLAAVAVKSGKQTSAVWIVCGVFTDAEYEPEFFHIPPIDSFGYQISEDKFYRVLDLLRASLNVFISIEKSRTQAVAKSEESKAQELEMTTSFHRAETMTEIVSLLDSDDGIENIMVQILSKLCGYLQISNGFTCRIHHNTLMDIVVQWNAQGCSKMFLETTDQEVCWFLGTEKAIVISSDTQMNAGEREQLDMLGIKALVAMPIVINGAPRFYACITENRESRIWSIDDVKFINDTIRILQSIITKRIQTNSLASSFASLEAVLDNVGSSIYVRDIGTGVLLFANRSFKKNFSKELAENKLMELFESNIPPRSHSGNYEVNHKARSKWYDVYYTRIKWVDGRPVSLCAIYDITEKKLYQKRIEQQAYTDFLTGLYNRMCCEKDLAKYVDDARNSGRTGALMYLDLDDFKHINDSLGHQYGDVLLQDISKAMSRIEGISNSCYRMGGDEFVIIVPPDNYHLMDKIIEEIKDAFATPWYLKDTDYYCTMSMGLVRFPENGDNVPELIRKSDVAMYEAKKSGKNRIAEYSDNIDSSSIHRLDLEKNMFDAIGKSCEEFEVYFQPVITNEKKARSGKGIKHIGAEALVRWNSDKLGFLNPDEFVPLAEYLGLINPIGNHVLKKACECCRQWNESGVGDFSVSVNLSVVQIMQTDIVDIIKECIEENNLKPENLILELTERLAINDLARTKQTLLDIKDLGVRLALDDFGTGYSALSSIRALPFDIIKVDKDFVKDIATDDYSQAFVRMMAQLGETIGADICVEGIETKEQLEAIKNMGVKYIQGYYYDKPLRRAAFEEKYVYNK